MLRNVAIIFSIVSLAHSQPLLNGDGIDRENYNRSSEDHNDASKFHNVTAGELTNVPVDFPASRENPDNVESKATSLSLIESETALTAENPRNKREIISAIALMGAMAAFWSAITLEYMSKYPYSGRIVALKRYVEESNYHKFRRLSERKEKNNKTKK